MTTQMGTAETRKTLGYVELRSPIGHELEAQFEVFTDGTADKYDQRRETRLP